MYFGRKNIETEPSCSNELTIFLNYHMLLSQKSYFFYHKKFFFLLETGIHYQ